MVSAFAPEVSAVLVRRKITTAKKIITNLDIKNKVITGGTLYAQEVLSSKALSTIIRIILRSIVMTLLSKLMAELILVRLR